MTKYIYIVPQILCIGSVIVLSMYVISEINLILYYHLFEFLYHNNVHVFIYKFNLSLHVTDIMDG